MDEDELRRVKLDFLAAQERGETLGPWLDRYPQYARELVDLAMATEAEHRLEAPSEDELVATREVLRRVAADVVGQPALAPAVGLVARARAVGVRVPQLARRVGLTAEVLYQLDRGYIRLETVPRALLRRLGEALNASAEAVLAGLPRTPPPAAAMAFNARERPAEARQQSFAEALAQAGDLPAGDRATWLAAVREEGLPE
jgi:hypothetical protein